MQETLQLVQKGNICLVWLRNAQARTNLQPSRPLNHDALAGSASARIWNQLSCACALSSDAKPHLKSGPLSSQNR
jgi:hypothetical protein